MKTETNPINSEGSLHRLVSGLNTNEKDAILELLILGVRDMESLMGDSLGVCGLIQQNWRSSKNN